MVGFYDSTGTRIKVGDYVIGVPLLKASVCQVYAIGNMLYLCDISRSHVGFYDHIADNLTIVSEQEAMWRILRQNA